MVGVLAGVLILAALGMAAPGSLSGNWGPKLGSVDLKVDPQGAQMIHLVYPEEFIVPADRILVVTAVNSYLAHGFSVGPGVGGPPVRVEFDDKLVFFASSGSTFGSSMTQEVPVGLTAREGVRVKLTLPPEFPGNSPNGATLLGYLDIE